VAKNYYRYALASTVLVIFKRFSSDRT